jgi:hypothetical protein
MIKLKSATRFLLILLLTAAVAACAESSWQNEPAVAAARKACQSDSGVEYECIERQAVDALNPEICRLAGIGVDDMCLQAVYEAADDPSICDQIYLQGVVPNCRAYYARSTPPVEAPETASPTHTPIPAALPSPSLTPTAPPTPTPLPTPLYTVDLSGYDPAIFPAIEIAHNPLLIAGADETVELLFHTVNVLCMKFPISCTPQSTLHYTYGEAGAYQSIPLAYEIVLEMEALIARLPATDEAGESLRYYVEFNVPEAGYTQRYPAAGNLKIFTAANLIPVDLPAENPVAPGETVYTFFWGFRPDQVRQAIYAGYPHRVGPPAMDVADDGRLALLDPVNERILIFNTRLGNSTSYSLPFDYNAGFNADLGFDPQGRLMVCDYQGQEYQATLGPDPVCYLLSPDGSLEAETAVYVLSPWNITPDRKIADYGDGRLVAPFNEQGQPNPREVQIDKETWDLPYIYVEKPYPVRSADLEAGLAFEVRSTSLGGPIGFQRTPQGYILVFGLGDHIRGVWIDPAGVVLKDVSLPYGQYTEINFNGQTAVGADGSLYALSSTERGIEIHFVEAP